MGVDLFFVLSGYLITGILWSAKDKKHYFRNFYIKRVLRIFPIYYLTLFFFFFLYPYLGSQVIEHSAYTYLSRHQLWFWTYLENWWFGMAGWPPSNILNHFWSLAIEEQFYIFWPFLIFLCNYRKVLVVCLMLFILSIIVRNCYPQLPFAYMNTFARLEGLSFGSLIAILFANKLLDLKKWSNVLNLFLFMILLVCYKWGYTDLSSPFNVRIGYTLSAIFFGLVLIQTFSDNALGSFLRKILSVRFLTFSGKISYGLYVYSMLVKVLFYSVFVEYLTRYIHSEFWREVMLSLLFMVFIYFISYLSFALLESKLISLKKKFIN